MSEATSLRDSGGLDYGHGSEDGGHWVDGPENQLGGRINRQVINWIFEERKSKLMPSWERGRSVIPCRMFGFVGTRSQGQIHVHAEDECLWGSAVGVSGKQWSF